MDEDEEHEFVYDQINGGKGKKPILSVLNKSKVSKYELDEIFCENR